MNETEQAQARNAIRHLQSVYNNCGDRGRIADLMAIFTEDGILDIPGQTFAGPDAIAKFLSGVFGGPPDRTGIDLAGSRHHLTTGRIEFDNPDWAQSWTYFLVIRRGTVIQEGTYIDTLTRRGGAWKIAHRRVKILWTQGD